MMSNHNQELEKLKGEITSFLTTFKLLKNGTNGEEINSLLKTTYPSLEDEINKLKNELEKQLKVLDSLDKISQYRNEFIEKAVSPTIDLLSTAIDNMSDTQLENVVELTKLVDLQKHILVFKKFELEKFQEKLEGLEKQWENKIVRLLSKRSSSLLRQHVSNLENYNIESLKDEIESLTKEQNALWKINASELKGGESKFWLERIRKEISNYLKDKGNTIQNIKDIFSTERKLKLFSERVERINDVLNFRQNDGENLTSKIFKSVPSEMRKSEKWWYIIGLSLTIVSFLAVIFIPMWQYGSSSQFVWEYIRIIWAVIVVLLIIFSLIFSWKLYSVISKMSEDKTSSERYTVEEIKKIIKLIEDDSRD